MNKRLAALFALLLPVFAYAANGPIIWQGSNSKDLTTGGLITPKVLIPENGSGSDKITVQAPASIAAAYSLTLPTTDGDADQCMVTNGSGVLSFTKIANANVDASAAIAYSKLNLSTSIVNADVSGSAAIARSKLGTGTADHVVINAADGTFSSEATLAKSRGGAGADMSSVTFPSTGTIVTRAASEALTNKTISGASNTLSGPIVGTTTNDTASSGQVGQIAQGTLSTLTNVDGTNDCTSVTNTGAIAAGDVDVAATFVIGRNGATVSDAPQCWVETVDSGSGCTGGSFGRTTVSMAIPDSTGNRTTGHVAFGDQLSGSVTYYLNCKAFYSAGGPMTVAGHIVARRVR